jgi:hypothetical protein
VKNSHYFTRKSTYCNKNDIFDFKDALSENSHRYNNRKFLYNCRLSHESFHLLLDETKHLPHFKPKRTNKHQPVALQLLVYLFRVVVLFLSTSACFFLDLSLARFSVLAFFLCLSSNSQAFFGLRVKKTFEKHTFLTAF